MKMPIAYNTVEPISHRHIIIFVARTASAKEKGVCTVVW